MTERICPNCLRPVVRPGPFVPLIDGVDVYYLHVECANDGTLKDITPKVAHG